MSDWLYGAPTEARNCSDTTWNSRQLLSHVRLPTKPENQSTTRSWTRVSSLSQIQGRVSCSATATDAASTICWEHSVSLGQASRDPGSVPVARPCAYRSTSRGSAASPAPAIRQAASRKERANPSRPSDTTPDQLPRPGSRYCAKPGVAYGTSASSIRSASASQWARVQPVREERSRSVGGRVRKGGVIRVVLLGCGKCGPVPAGPSGPTGTGGQRSSAVCV